MEKNEMNPAMIDRLKEIVGKIHAGEGCDFDDQDALEAVALILRLTVDAKRVPVNHHAEMSIMVTGFGAMVDQGTYKDDSPESREAQEFGIDQILSFMVTTRLKASGNVTDPALAQKSLSKPLKWLRPSGKPKPTFEELQEQDILSLKKITFEELKDQYDSLHESLFLCSYKGDIFVSSVTLMSDTGLRDNTDDGCLYVDSGKIAICADDLDEIYIVNR